MKRILALVISALMVFSLVAACNNDSGGSSPDTSTNTPAGNTESPANTPDSGGENTPDAGGQDPAPGAPTQYSQGASDDKIIIANSAATSGALAVVGVPFNAGIEAYLDMVNAAGGIDGRIVEFVHYTDDEADPAKGKAALEGIVEDLKAFAVVGHFGTPVVSATVEDLRSYGIPAVYFATGIGQLYVNNARSNADGFNLFPVQPLYATEGRILTAYAAGMFGAGKIGVIYTNDDAGMDLYKGVTEQVADMGGRLEVVAEQVTAGAADVSAAVTSIRNADVDIIIVASIQATFPTIVKELAAQSVNKDCITTYVNTALAMSEAIIGDVTGKFDVYSTGWVDASDLDSFYTFAEWIPADYVANSFAMAGWIAGATFCEGLYRIAGQDITWENYMRALEESPVPLPFGAAVNYADGNRWGTQAMNLAKACEASEEWPLGWETVAPMTNISDLT